MVPFIILIVNMFRFPINNCYQLLKTNFFCISQILGDACVLVEASDLDESAK